MLTKKTFISSKFYSMLAGGIVTSFLLTFTVMADAFIAGIVLGEDAVIGVNLVLPVYSFASFFALLFSIGAPILYSKEIGAFDRKEADRTFGVGVLGTTIAGSVLFVLLSVCGNMYLDSSYYVLIDKIPLGVLICAIRDFISAVPLAVIGGNSGGYMGCLLV
jgi:hypothetical protein